MSMAPYYAPEITALHGCRDLCKLYTGKPDEVMYGAKIAGRDVIATLQTKTDSWINGSDITNVSIVDRRYQIDGIDVLRKEWFDTVNKLLAAEGKRTIYIHNDSEVTPW